MRWTWFGSRTDLTQSRKDAETQRTVGMAGPLLSGHIPQIIFICTFASWRLRVPALNSEVFALGAYDSA